MPRTFRHYRAYGLMIRSELPLPELVETAGSSRPDLDIRLDAVEGPMPEADQPRLVRFGEADAYLSWPGIARIRLGDDGRIAIDALGDEDKLVRFALIGPVLAAALQLRGVPLLHGSAVSLGGRALLVLGHKGAGKSTMAAALAAGGAHVLNDDVLPLVLLDGSIGLAAGYPGLKLPRALHELLLPHWPIAGSRAADDDDKAVVADPALLTGTFAIAALLVLDPKGGDRPVELPPAAALPELLQHAYSLKFGESALGAVQREALFATCARLAREKPVLRASRPNGIGHARAFAEEVVSRVAALDSPEIRAVTA